MVALTTGGSRLEIDDNISYLICQLNVTVILLYNDTDCNVWRENGTEDYTA